MISRPSLSSGFTLIEVMIALVLLVLSIGAVLTSIGQHSFHLQQTRDRFHAQRVAMHVAGQYKVLGDWPGLGSRDDTITVGQTRWKWKAVTTSTPDQNMRRVTISVFSPQASGPDAVVVIFLARPL